MSLFFTMLMSVNSVKNTPLKSTEFNQLWSDFLCFNQKCNNAHYLEHLETQEDDAFESTCNIRSIESFTVVKYHMLNGVFMLMDANEPPAKVSSKMKVMLFARNWKTSNVLSCTEACFCETGQAIVKDDENTCTFSVIDRIRIKSSMEEHCRPVIGSNHCKKVKELTLEKLEREGRDTFLHKYLKTMKEFLNDVDKSMFLLDGKGHNLKSRG